MARRDPEDYEEPKLVVFLSSKMDEELSDDRTAADQAVESIHRIVRLWRFEDAPASSQEVTDSYLSSARQCDMFVLLIGSTISEAVIEEWRAARASHRPILVFVKTVVRDSQTMSFLKDVRTHRRSYISTSELVRHLRTSIINEIARRYRSTLSEQDRVELARVLQPDMSRSLDELLDHTVLGIRPDPFFRRMVGLLRGRGSDPLMVRIYKQFGATTVAPASTSPDDYEYIYFDNLAESRRASLGLSRVLDKVKAAPVSRRQKVLMNAIKLHIQAEGARQLRQKMGQEPITPNAPGCEFMALHIHRDIAPLIRLANIRQAVMGEVQPHRNVVRLYIKQHDLLLAAQAAVEEAVREPGDGGFWLKIAEHALRYRIERAFSDHE